MSAYAEARRLFPDDDIQVVSLGTGRATEPYPFQEAIRWGFSQWLSPIGRFRTPLLSSIQDGQARAANWQLEFILGENYYRFDHDLSHGLGSERLDDASRRNLKRLTKGALAMVQDEREKILALVQALTPSDANNGNADASCQI